MIALHELNAATPTVFVQSLDGVFEHSPWVAERTAAHRPFDSRLGLLDAMRSAMSGASAADQMALIQAHPRLGSRGRQRAELTSASASEQRRAGLDACTVDELQRLDELNAAYVARFDMPYILAVRGHDPKSIIAHAERRLANSASVEREQALREIGLIAGFRLADVVTSPAAAEILAMFRRLMMRNRASASVDSASVDSASVDTVSVDTASVDTVSGDAGWGNNVSGDTASRDTPDLMIREWLLAADFEVSDECGTLLGRRRCGADPSQTLVVGESRDSIGGALRDESLRNSLVGIAVAQQLRERGVRLPFDLLVRVRREAQLGQALPDASVLEHSARALEANILQNAQSFEHGGTLQYG